MHGVSYEEDIVPRGSGIQIGCEERPNARLCLIIKLLIDGVFYFCLDYK